MTITARYGEKLLTGLPDAIHNEAATVHRKKAREIESVAKFRRNRSATIHGEI